MSHFYFVINYQGQQVSFVKKKSLKTATFSYIGRLMIRIAKFINLNGSGDFEGEDLRTSVASVKMAKRL